MFIVLYSNKVKKNFLKKKTKLIIQIVNMESRKFVRFNIFIVK